MCELDKGKWGIFRRIHKAFDTPAMFIARELLLAGTNKLVVFW
jgi:hypothetical protein